MTGLLLSDDLIDASKVIASARTKGIAIVQVRQLAMVSKWIVEQNPDWLIFDLHHAEVDLRDFVTKIREKKDNLVLIAYGSHVHAQQLKAARQAGCDRVLPRSEFFEEMLSGEIWDQPFPSDTSE